MSKQAAFEGYMDGETGKWVGAPVKRKAPGTSPEVLSRLQEEQKALDAMTDDLLKGIL